MLPRSKQHDGRRMLQEGQFHDWLPTYKTDRETRSQADRREYNRIKQRELRARRAASRSEEQVAGVETAQPVLIRREREHPV